MTVEEFINGVLALNDKDPSEEVFLNLNGTYYRLFDADVVGTFITLRGKEWEQTGKVHSRKGRNE